MLGFSQITFLSYIRSRLSVPANGHDQPATRLWQAHSLWVIQQAR